MLASLRKLPILKQVDEEGSLADILKEETQADDGLDEAERLEATFNAVQDKFDVMEHLE